MSEKNILKLFLNILFNQIREWEIIVLRWDKYFIQIFVFKNKNLSIFWSFGNNKKYLTTSRPE